MFKLVWKGPLTAMEAGATYLSEVLDPPADAVGLARADGVQNTTPTDDDGVDWTLEAYFQETPDADALTSAITAFDPAFSNAEAGDVETLPEQDWVAHALEGLGVVEAGSFLLYGVHDADKVEAAPDSIPIRIDANQAFGTGHHPTTAGCLTLLSRFAGAPPEKILDLGCGSGVLSIAAAKLWDANVLAVDIDETSVAIARENAKLNGVADKLTIETANGFDHALVADAAPFDFIFANILAGPLIEFAPAIAAHANNLGRVMLAGLLAEQEAGVNEAFRAAGFKQINRLADTVWPVLLYVKP